MSVYEKKVDDLGRAYATGKRKTSVARVWIKSGKGAFSVNGERISDYFEERSALHVFEPLNKLDAASQFDVFCTVAGGGFTGQAGAIRHGLSKALMNYDPGYRGVLKSNGLLTRDARIVERKKYGQPGARANFTYVKR